MFRNLNWSGMTTVYGLGIDQNYLYGAAAGDGAICRYRLSDGSFNNKIIITGAAGNCQSLASDGTYIYTAVGNIVSKWSATTFALIEATWCTLPWISGANSCVFSILTNNTQLFIESKAYNKVYQISISDRNLNYTYDFSTGNISSNSTIIGTFPLMGSTSRNITTDSQYAYLSTSSNVVKIDSINHTVTSIASSGYNGLYGIATDGINVYLYDDTKKCINSINLNTYQVSETIFPTITSTTGVYGMIVYNWKLYVSSSVNPTNVYEYQLPIPPVPYPCFNRGSKILTNRGYIAIENLKKHDLIKTVCHGYKRITYLGKRDISHGASEKRIANQLYVCSKSVYADLFEDLILTGCHAILVDEWNSDDEMQRAIEVYKGKVYITDNYYRLPACADLRTKVYECPGDYTIYHVALENSDYYSNYGIYANGLLVESCSQRYLKELSGLQLITPK